MEGFYCAACPEQTFNNKCDQGELLCSAVNGTWIDSLCSCQFGPTDPITNTTIPSSGESNSTNSTSA